MNVIEGHAISDRCDRSVRSLRSAPTLPRTLRVFSRTLGLGIVVLLLACALADPARAQGPTLTLDAPSGGGEPSTEAISPADIPARADADELFIQAVVQRSQSAGEVRRLEDTLTRQSAGVRQLTEQSNRNDLALLSVNRLETLQRHWFLYERELARTRAGLSQATRASAEAAAGLANRRAAWQATKEASVGLAPSLLQRVGELIGQIERAEASLSAPLGKLLDLGRRANVLSTQVQSGAAALTSRVEDQDRRLLIIDTPPLWQAMTEGEPLEPLNVGLRKSLDIEKAMARAYDEANVRVRPAFIVVGLLLLPFMLWLERRAAKLVASGQASARSMQTLSHPWAAWLVLVALGAVLYDFQGPIIRQEAVLLLAWIPVLVLLPLKIRTFVGPWAYLSAAFYFLNMVASLLLGDQLLYRSFLLALNLLMLLTLGWLVLRAFRTAPDVARSAQGKLFTVVLLGAAAVLIASAVSNIVGNVSLSAMLTGAVLDSTYVALALYAGALVPVALFRVLLFSPKMSTLATRHVGTLIPVAARLGRNLLLATWLVYTLQSFRVYRPLTDMLIAVLTHVFNLGVISFSLGNLVSFVAATWVTFWLAGTIRALLSKDILPSLSLPRGVGNSISTLTYYTLLFLGLLAALAAAGFQVGQLAIVFGALGLGIGLGLQDVVKNFVSGMILMVERPIQPGDVVDVAGMSGTVRDIGLRATIVTTFEGAEVVVPNGMLLADKLVNWTLSGTRRRINVDVSTGYGVGPQRTIDLLVGIARTVPGIAAMPAPAALLTGLAPGALEFNLRAWTTDQADWVSVRSELSIKIKEGLAEAGIEVPLPQRDLHVRHVPAGQPPAPAAR